MSLRSRVERVESESDVRNLDSTLEQVFFLMSENIYQLECRGIPGLPLVLKQIVAPRSESAITRPPSAAVSFAELSVLILSIKGLSV